MQNLSIRARLALAMAFLGSMLSLSVGFGLHGTSATHESARDIAENSLSAVNALGISSHTTTRARLSLD
ncbi:Tar ligand binding domain-containing protein [Caballeronia sp. AZ10_KS36]|uniref:Tar ligand binding domain-containing protein n=1 Tax=Caballeronia sp. AZ10_KS36 TaxID=2921757 RepID=UPI002028FA69|nr:Tar ligand binding domain-containing protein [Caballeronia sp. AZ10_KS36]